MISVSVLLDEARAAYHDLQIGKGVASARDSDGSEIRYTQAESGRLRSYITSLEKQIADAAGGRPSVAGPMRFTF